MPTNTASETILRRTLRPMIIGFDAKRAFHNRTGLGNYCRTLITALSTYYPNHQYLLYNPKAGNGFQINHRNMQEIKPQRMLDKLWPSLWRTTTQVKDIRGKVDIFHGLSNELPLGIRKAAVKKLVSIHDIIFEDYPDQYGVFDVQGYRYKTKHACAAADHIVAISEATKTDLIHHYKIPASKISVAYQSFDPRFFIQPETTSPQNLFQKYQLHKPYFISVGSLIERKNVLQTIEAMHILDKHCDADLVIVGKGGSYKKTILEAIQKYRLQPRVHFLEDHFPPQDIVADLPLLYHYAQALIYTSQKEGFGIPLLEAMAAETAVITSSVSSLAEVSGGAALCVNPNDNDELAAAMQQILSNSKERNLWIEKGKQRVTLFSPQAAADAVMNVYLNLYMQ